MSTQEQPEQEITIGITFWACIPCNNLVHDPEVDIFCSQCGRVLTVLGLGEKSTKKEEGNGNSNK